jgi:hypothetical protein
MSLYVYLCMYTYICIHTQSKLAWTVSHFCSNGCYIQSYSEYIIRCIMGFLKHTYMYMCVCIYVYTCLHTISKDTYMYMCVCIYIYTCLHTISKDWYSSLHSFAQMAVFNHIVNILSGALDLCWNACLCIYVCLYLYIYMLINNDPYP